ncbi:MAG TPA: hypothetical protein VHZ97_06355 [Pseudonocardiaceae bacterium]|nr:hypothetical protein [Pseudonocardiaceae bacterium]
MNTEQEIQLSDDLRHLVVGHSFTADPDALLLRGRQARRRSMATRGAAGIGVLAVAAAGTVVGLDAGGSGTPSVQDAAYVVKHVSAVLDSDKDYVYQMTEPSQGTVEYLDQTTTNQYFVAGTGNTRVVSWDSSPVVDHYTHLRNTTVNYQNHTYSTSDDKVGGYISGPEPKESNIVDRVRQGINSGQDKILGTGEYQGHQVIKLGWTEDSSNFQLWVDSTTYQPVHSISTGPDGDQDATDLAFLPRTPDLVHTMNTPQIPAGFTKVAEASNIGHGG